MFTLLVTSGLASVTVAVAVGISPSMASSAALLGPLTLRPTRVPRTYNFSVTAILKVTVITFTRERCELDSGLESVPQARNLLMDALAGIQCPGSLLKRWQKLSSNHVTRDPLDFLEEV